jgi:endonuclease YncB( thermonuclease family)
MKYNGQARLRDPDAVNGDVVYDGDTFKVMVNPWTGSYFGATIRLFGVDTAELYGENHETAIEQRDFVRDWLGSEAGGGGNYPFEIEAMGEDSFGRTLAKIKRKSDGEDLSEAVLNEFGQEYEYDE